MKTLEQVTSSLVANGIKVVKTSKQLQKAMNAEIIGYKETFINEDGMHEDRRTYSLQSNVKLPTSKANKNRAERYRKAFKAYCDEYERLYIRRPTGFQIAENDFIVIRLHSGVVAFTGSLKRIKERTVNMRSQVRE